ncbi:MAG: type I-E CRISPR-associated protein Cas5/CasD [Parvularcula sp.]
MREYLVFTLTANMGSMGELAGHERRGSWTWPGRSAVLGLLAAAKGIRRDEDFSAVDALQLGVAVFDAGTPLRDYHTVQTIPTAKSRKPQSRPAAMREAGLGMNTTITHRDYRTCPLYGVAVVGDELDGWRAALERPVFTLYLGRKSCPLSTPLSPSIVSAGSTAEALENLKLPPWWRTVKPVANMLYTDIDGETSGHSETRHDAALDRKGWHFTERRYFAQSVSIAPEGDGS